MRVAILMPVYNGGKTLISAVKSIVDQTYPKDLMRLFLVDNNSTDNAVTELDDWMCQYDDAGNPLTMNWSLLQCSEPGIVPALNKGLFKILSGNYDLIARMDADDYWYPEKLAKQVEFMKANPDVHILGTQINLVAPSGHMSNAILVQPTDDKTIKEKLLSGQNAIAHPSVVYRPEIFLRTGGYDNMYPIAEDYHLWLKALRWYNFANLDEKLMNYTVGHNPKYNPLCPQLACMAAKQAYQRLHGT